MTEYQRQVAAPVPSYGGLFEPVFRYIDAWRRRRRFATLAGLDDRQLKDIGLTRDDVAWGMRLPVRENAAVQVRYHRSARQVGVIR